jgi:hypothetical protein
MISHRWWLPRKVRRQAARGAARGVIYIEALLVISALLIIFAAAIFLGAAYKAKLETYDSAASAAFRNAERGCGAPLGGSMSPGALAANLGATGSEPSLLGGVTAADPGQATYSLQNPSVLFAARTWTFDTRVQLLCNEVPIDEAQAWDALGAEPWAVQGILTAAGF